MSKMFKAGTTNEELINHHIWNTEKLVKVLPNNPNNPNKSKNAYLPSYLEHGEISEGAT